ncbi:Transcriptional activator MetR [hydrothermal vent metagenome]|uniref:Transcriptional activator MetR n=1 Tax=hydrothermal vent metagenome TaxID=652676 RepID=A0A3B0ZJ14_9ZZZZ
MIEHSHLKIIQALDKNGTLTEAANALCLTQSALSHQIRYLEKKLEVTLWEREGRNLRLTQAGKLLLETANKVLPVLAQAEKMLEAYSEGKQGILRIGVECYPCYEWLTGVIGSFLEQLPNVEIDIINKFQFSGLEGLLNHYIDILVTPDLDKNDVVDYVTLAEYELLLLANHRSPLVANDYISAEDLGSETLIAFPVPHERLDILTQFMNPACVKPKKIKKIESIELMLQLVAQGRGVCVLPNWLANKYIEKLSLKSTRIGVEGLYQKLYVSLRKQDSQVSYIQKFISIAKNIANTRIAID